LKQSDEVQAALAAQLAYYRRRAPEYNETFMTEEEFASFGPRVIERLAPSGHVLELACGTGRWTSLMAPRVESITALDAAPEMIEMARRRVDSSVEYVLGDIFAWTPRRRYDTVFFGYWLSHVPPQLFGTFWQLVRRALAPGGRALFVDGSDAEAATGKEVILSNGLVPSVERRVSDGSVHHVVKVWYGLDELTRLLADEGWDATIWPEGVYLAGSATAAREP
jgi:SAM-dependent methyltransferase